MSRAGKGVFTAHTMVQGSLEELDAGAAGIGHLGIYQGRG